VTDAAGEPAPLDLPPALRLDLEEAAAHPEIVVVTDPSPDLLEAYGLEEGLGVIAVVSGGAKARVAALEAGALEVLDPAQPEAELRARLEMAVARFRSRLHLEKVRDELDKQAVAMERNLRLAARLQRSLLPQVLPDGVGLGFATAYLPQEFVSGDSYDVRALGPRHVVLYTADSVGHGVKAALLTVLLRTVLAPAGADGAPRPPHEVLNELNGYLLDARLEESPTAAFCYALFDTETRLVRLANAGHPLPLLIRREGEDVTTIHVGGSGLLLGVDPMPYETHELQLRPGDRVVFFTDGADPEYDGAFAEQLRLHAGLSLEDQLAGALGAVIALDQEGRPEDDVTAVAIEVVGEVRGEARARPRAPQAADADPGGEGVS